jgi:hypothetical protein
MWSRLGAACEVGGGPLFFRITDRTAGHMAGIESYPVECPCGGSTTVGIHQCGLQTACPKCGQPLKVPDLKTLRAESGDPYPTLARIRKIQKAIADRLPPFDGRCVSCGAAGTQEVPVLFREVRERFVTDHGGFRLGGTGIGAGRPGEETVEETEIPIVLCDVCVAQFERSRQTRRGNRTMQFVGLAAVAAILQIVFRVWWVTLIAVGLLFGFMERKRQIALAEELKRPTWLDPWIAKVRWFPEAIGDAMECELKVGSARPRR